MQQALHHSNSVPRGFVVESAYYEGDKAIVVVRASGSVGLCPSCGTASQRVHSRYRRRVTDLPLSGRPAPGNRPPFSLRCGSVWASDLHRALRRRPPGTIGAPHGETGVHRSPPWLGAWGATGSKLRKAADAAGEQRYPSSGGSTP